MVRSAIQLDRETGQATILTDPLPQFKEGIPLPYRAVVVDVNRPGFSLNPTSCQRKQTLAALTSIGGKSANPTSVYQATNCARLAFKPKLSVRLIGGTRRGSYPKVHGSLTMPKGGANLASVSSALPHSEFIENAHFKTICTRVQFAAHECPPGSIYGTAVATTPILDVPLEGPVYLRSSKNPLPDLVIALKGPPSLPIEADGVAKVDTVNGGLRISFEAIPDVPLTKVTLRMEGGKKGLIVNSTNLCEGTHRVTTKLKAQNGKEVTLRSPLQTSCAKHKRR